MELFYDNYKIYNIFWFKLSLLNNIQILICEICNIPICCTHIESIFSFNYVDILGYYYLLSENQ